jgi:hypothetical protein
MKRFCGKIRWKRPLTRSIRGWEDNISWDLRALHSEHGYWVENLRILSNSRVSHLRGGGTWGSGTIPSVSLHINSGSSTIPYHITYGSGTIPLVSLHITYGSGTIPSAYI